jgi:hypothetical protein
MLRPGFMKVGVRATVPQSHRRTHARVYRKVSGVQARIAILEMVERARYSRGRRKHLRPVTIQHILQLVTTPEETGVNTRCDFTPLLGWPQGPPHV